MSSSSNRSFQFHLAVYCSLLFASVPLACAVGVEPAFEDVAAESSAGSLPNGGARPVGILPGADPPPPTGGNSSPFGGTSATGGAATGGKSGASAGSAGSAGARSGGSGGVGGANAGGSAGSSTTGCVSVKTWQGNDSTFMLTAGEAVQWMGKRYKAAIAITYPNAECSPDNPADWCKAWFTADGDC